MNTKTSHTDNILAKEESSVTLAKSFDLIDLLVVIVGVSLYIYVARIWQPTYMVKSATKALAFVVLPLVSSYLLRQDISWLRLRMDRTEVKKYLIRVLLIAAAVISFLLLISETLNEFFRVAKIIDEVKNRTNASRQLVLASLVYISVVNSFMEEVYFRGFLLVRLEGRYGYRPASWISALLFAAYHLITFRSWFSPPLLLLVLSALTFAGLVLNHITIRYRSLLPVWFIHALMNFTIFTVILPYI
ncbi:MAG: CPBP family intramembrane metalloprotease [Clostridiaceae bacterium]|nr:CPBP family intramembrane metalloprotease [Clostridiaceae bacterium]